jgi:hypothetical protein
MVNEDVVITGIFTLIGVVVGSGIGYKVSKKLQDRQFKKEVKDKLESFYDLLFKTLFEIYMLAEKFEPIKFLSANFIPTASILVHVRDTSKKVNALIPLINAFNPLKQKAKNIIFDAVVFELQKISTSAFTLSQIYASNIVYSSNFVNNILLETLDEEDAKWFDPIMDKLNVKIGFSEFFKTIVNNIKDDKTIIEVKAKRKEIIDYCKELSDFIQSKLEEPID